ncbi:smad nuclear-interacting protein 1 [Bufo gargarizans]|uniref:smad nuclear-interacting protein 1 n=1 Tax=Bufo gargarizans TaxID=30331 RepID=UPI001CF525FA|nr:smad nuclear-interacting protein 1 [Bufo gargarizans]
MKEVRDEGRHKKKRQYSPVPVKEERGSPARRHRAPRSPGDSEGDSPAARKRSRSPGKRKKSSIKRSRSPRNRRHRSASRSPPHLPVKIKQERDEHSHRTHDERQPTYREEEPRRDRHRDQTDRGRHNVSRHREREREENNLREQRADRKFHNNRRRERRQREEQEEEPGNESDSASKNKDAPNFELSGALLEDTNTFRGVVIKYSEPPEARIPKKRWRLYPFKNDEALPVMYIHRQSAYLLGRQRRIADIPIDHPSCSKQHAALQYRMVAFTRKDGTLGRRVRPYIIDLGSGNGTYLNNQRIEPQRYYELKEKDVLKFGFSSREYVVLHESSDTSEVDNKQDDDEEDEGEDEATDEEKNEGTND